MTPIKSPTKAIHAFCVTCNGSGVAANACPTTKCLLHPYRKGTVPREANIPYALSIIRKYCLHCVGNVPEAATEVKNCTADGVKRGCGQDHHLCNLYPFRFGTNPFRKKRVYGPPSEAQLAALKEGRTNRIKQAISPRQNDFSNSARVNDGGKAN